MYVSLTTWCQDYYTSHAVCLKISCALRALPVTRIPKRWAFEPKPREPGKVLRDMASSDRGCWTLMLGTVVTTWLHHNYYLTSRNNKHFSTLSVKTSYETCSRLWSRPLCNTNRLSCGESNCCHTSRAPRDYSPVSMDKVVQRLLLNRPKCIFVIYFSCSGCWKYRCLRWIRPTVKNVYAKNISGKTRCTCQDSKDIDGKIFASMRTTSLKSSYEFCDTLSCFCGLLSNDCCILVYECWGMLWRVRLWWAHHMNFTNYCVIAWKVGGHHAIGRGWPNSWCGLRLLLSLPVIHAHSWHWMASGSR